MKKKRDVDVDFKFLGADLSKNFSPVKDDVLKRLAEERAFDGDIWAFKSMFKSIEIKNLNESDYTISFQVILEMKKYFFDFEKRQGIWFLVEFKEIQ